MRVERVRNGAAAALISIAAGTSLAAAPGLVAAYGFEENAGPISADASGNGNTAFLVGATWTVQGKYGNALDFDGLSARVTVIHDAPALRLTAAMTLEAWVKRSSSLSAWTDVVYKGKDNYFLESATPTSGRPAAGGILGGASALLLGPSAIPVGTWTHLASTYDGATLRLYVNGTQVASAAQTGALLTSGFPLQIGGDSFYGQRFAGTIDEVRVYGRALTPAEIQADMGTPLVVPVSDTTPPGPPASPAAAPFSGTSIALAWGAATDDVAVARYRLERCRGTGCGDFQDIALVEGTTYTDTALALSTTYAYRVSAVDAGGNLGPPSSVASTKTLSGASIPGLVAAYGFETGSGPSATDSSGLGNHGTLAGAIWTTGRYGQALSFNGTSAKVNVPDAPSLRLTTALTLSAWVKATSISASTQWVDVLYKGNDNYYILASSDIDHQPELGGILGTGKHILFALKPLTIGTWTHLALTYDGAMLRVYADGSLVSSSPQTGAFITSTRPLQIGGDDDYGQHFTGSIDEVRLYNRALSAEEVRADMAAPVAGATNPTPVTSALAPDAVVAGAAGVTLDVSGTGFTAASVVLWDDAPRETQLVSPSLLRATIPATDLTAPRTVPIAVFNAPPIGGTSNAQSLTVCAGSLWYRDTDGDGRGDAAQQQSSCAQPQGFVAGAGDCDDSDATAWDVPGEIEGLSLPDRQTIAWSPPGSPGGATMRYDTFRSDSPGNFELTSVCLETDGDNLVSTDPSDPTDGAAFFYLVRAGNSCGEGMLGPGRTGRACP